MDDKSPSPTVETVWSQYDPARDAHCGGIYIFLLKPFGNAPYLVGETGTFSRRFSEHDKFFKTGKRTFFRRPFVAGAVDKSHRGFGLRWQEIKRLGADKREEFLFVPGRGKLTVGDEGQRYNEDSTIRLCWTINSNSKERKSFEMRIQTDVERYYTKLVGPNLNLAIPDTRSLLVGSKQGDLNATPSISYRLSTYERSMDAPTFFETLAQL